MAGRYSSTSTFPCPSDCRMSRNRSCWTLRSSNNSTSTHISPSCRTMPIEGQVNGSIGTLSSSSTRASTGSFARCNIGSHPAEWSWCVDLKKREWRKSCVSFVMRDEWRIKFQRNSDEVNSWLKTWVEEFKTWADERLRHVSWEFLLKATRKPFMNSKHKMYDKNGGNVKLGMNRRKHFVSDYSAICIHFKIHSVVSCFIEASFNY